MNIINAKAFLKAVDDVNCGRANIVQLNSADFEIKQETTNPLDGYEPPEGFPNCCNYHRSILKIGIERFENFPNCCESHKKLNAVSWFKKSNYSYLPHKLVTTLNYTIHCISSCIDKLSWYKDITDYIEYTTRSYGQFPDGFGAPLGSELYLYNLEKKIESLNEISDDKKEKLLTFIKKYYEPEITVEQTDFNLLISKYKEWLKIFPFELSFFSHLKEHFENRMPILSGKGETNIYTGLTAYKVKTKKELIGFLVSVTSKIIIEINTRNLYQKDLLKGINDLQIEVLMANRKVELEELNKTSWDDRKDYIKLLKTWLKGEKKFLSEITPLLKQVQSNSTFIDDLLDGIRNLQKNDTNEPCILNVREDKPGKETAFRYWFKNFFSARYPDASITAEEEKGNGRIDLKISQKNLGDKIIEFKGWWNQDKANVSQQICSYLTDFENDGYIFMMNHLALKDITQDYENLISSTATNYIKDSWKEHKLNNTDFSYYESSHKLSVKRKVIYHFIFNVHFSNQIVKKKRLKNNGK